MAISTNPTKTRGIEKAWRREINRRWARFTRDVIKELRVVGGFSVNVVIGKPRFNVDSVTSKMKQVDVLFANDEADKARAIMDKVDLMISNAFEADPDQLRAYIAFFQRKIDELLVGDWQEKYQQRSYELAVNRFIQEIKRQESLKNDDVGMFNNSMINNQRSFFGIIIEAFGKAKDFLTRPVHQDELNFLFTRSFEALEGLTDDMARQIRIILFNGAQQGIGIDELTIQIKKRIGVSKTRARLIAQTETIQAFQRGTINQAKLTSEVLGEDVGLRWLTVRDVKVRHIHVGFHGQMMSQKEASRNINISPFNCRCGLSPVIEESDTEAKRVKFSKERSKLRALTNEAA